jgi:membrane protein insertase Oxa1/YidC/SpoIIIJ
MMTWMFPLMTAWIGYTLVAALPLYWAVSNGISILQQTLTMREEVDKMEEAKVVTKVREATGNIKKPKSKSKGKAKRKKG